MAGPEHRAGLCSLIRREAWVAQAIVPERPVTTRAGGGEAEAARLLEAVCTEVRGFRYVDVPGPAVDLADVIAARSGNCRDLAALMVSALRALGVEGARVLFGSAFGLFPANLHAWALVETDATLTLVDPANCIPRTASPQEILTATDPIALFHDEECVLGSAQVRAALTGREARSRTHI